MPKVSDLSGVKVFVVKDVRRPKEGQPTTKLSKLGKVHMAVFTPDGRRVVGFLVRRPDVAGMVKREDVFLAVDSYAPVEKGIRVTRGDDAFDDAARERLHVNWDACIMWAGMDAKTSDGKVLGYVNDAEFEQKTGKVTKFLVGDGGMARALVGSLEIPPSMLISYANGCMIVSPEAASLALNGGLAAKAGEASAKAKVKSAEFGEKAGAAASEAVDKGSFALGKAIGKAKRAMEEAQAEDAEPEAQLPATEAADVRVSEPVGQIADGGSARETKTYRPAATSASTGAAKATGPAKATSTAKATGTAKKKAPVPKVDGDRMAKDMGRQLGKMGKMFGSFKDEFDKSSK